MPFFENSSDFSITGGTFNDYPGNVNRAQNEAYEDAHRTRQRGATDSHIPRNNGRRRTHFPRTGNGGQPGRAQPQWSYPTANPQPHNGQDRGDPSQFRGAPPQPAQPLRGLPDPRAPRPGDEVAAQIHQGAPIFPRTATAPPRFAQPNFPADNQQPRSASTSQGPAQTAAIPIPGARTNDRVLRTFSLPQPGDSVLSSSPESVDLEPPQGPSKVNRTVSQNDSQRRQS